MSNDGVTPSLYGARKVRISSCTGIVIHRGYHPICRQVEWQIILILTTQFDRQFNKRILITYARNVWMCINSSKIKIIKVIYGKWFISYILIYFIKLVFYLRWTKLQLAFSQFLVCKPCTLQAYYTKKYFFVSDS